jgi:hypothetical protein
MSNEPEYLYYNLRCKNSEDLSNDPDCKTADDRRENILNNAKNYKVAVVRFSIANNMNIPLFIPIIEQGQSDENKTIYYFAMKVQTSQKNSATVYTSQLSSNVTFVSQFTTLTAPAPTGSNTQHLDNQYYHCHDYQHVVDLFNTTLTALHSDVKSDLDAKRGAAVTGWIAAPKIVYDSDANKFTIYFDSDGFGQDDLTFTEDGDTSYEYKAQLFMNSNLFALLSNFPHEKQGDDQKNTVGLPYFNYLLKPKNKLGTNLYSYGGVDYIKLTQDFASLSAWNPISSIVFTSNLLGAQPEVESQFREYLDGNEIKLSSANLTSKTVSDLELPIFSSDAWKQTIFYQPSKYRFMSLSSTIGKIKHIDFQINLRYRLDGKIRPMKMYNQSDTHGRCSI